MLTKDDLEQIAKLLIPLKEQLDTVEMKVEVVNKRTERIEQKLDREVTDLAENTKEIMTKLDVLEDHETRIKQLEPTEFPRSH
jgi:chromosome segregation ATPase